MFKLRSYGRTELAQMYCPDIAAESAWKKFRRWIRLAPGLEERLRQMGYTGRERSFTPSMVAAIVEAIGEP